MLVAVVAWFYRYSQTRAFQHGELKRATLEFLMVVGPFFGVHVKPPRPEPPAVLTPKGDEDEGPHGFTIADSRDHPDDPSGGTAR